MKNIILLLVVLCNFTALFAQNTIKAVLKNRDTNDMLIGVTAVIQNTNLGGITDENGFLEITNIPDGQQSILFTAIGFETKTEQFIFPLAST